MKIEDYNYKGYIAEINFQSKGSTLNQAAQDTFYAVGLFTPNGNFKDIEALRAAFRAVVDSVLAECPTTPEGWVELLEACLVWTSHEECHLNARATMRVLELYRQKGAAK